MRGSAKTTVLGALLAGWIFLLPTHFFLSHNRESARLHGLLNNYLVLTLYASELVMILISLWLLPETRQALSSTWHRLNSRQRRGVKALGLGFLLLGLTQIRAEFPLVAGLNWVKFLALSWFVLSLALLNSQYLPSLKRWLVSGLLGAIWFQVSLGWLQYWRQTELIGYPLLGEPHFQAWANLATGQLANGATRYLAYGTTAHPNLLANIVISFAFLSWWLTPTRSRRQTLFLALTSLLAASSLLITHSWTAGLVALSGGGLWLMRPRLAALRLPGAGKWFGWLLLGLIFVSYIVIPLSLWAANQAFDAQGKLNYSLSRRAWLQTASLSLSRQHPWVGLGLTQFTLALTKFAHTPDQWRFLQPVHQAGWLWWSETGLLGLFLLINLFALSSTRLRLALLLSLCLLLFPFSLDHFLLSLPEGRALALLVLISFYWTEKVNTHHPVSTSFPNGSTWHIKKDRYRQARGGYSTLLEIKCAQCLTTLFFYQKDGPGPLKRCYLDRILYVSPTYGTKTQAQTHWRSANLFCTHCQECLGSPMNYEKEARAAIKMKRSKFKMQILAKET